MSNRFAIFDTPIGPCGIVWNARGIAGVQLPEGDAAKTRTRLARRFPEASESSPDETIEDVIRRIVALLGGERIDLSDVALDMNHLPEFNRRVYDIARTIQPGNTMTYGDIAKKLGDVALSRDVGQALGQNPTPIIMPCHRVVAASGKTGGFSAPGGVDTKLKMLSIELARTSKEATLFDGDPAFALAAKPKRRA